MGLEAHAERELRLAGLFDKDSDYNGMIGDAVMALVKVFASQGHSGYSAGMVRSIFNMVADYKVLTPITSNPDEWMEVGPGAWQNKRQFSVFSKDGGQTWYDIDEKVK